MFKGQKRDVQRAGEERGQKQLVSYQNILTNIWLSNDLCKFFLFSHDPISRLFESFLGTFIKDQKIANWVNDMGDFYVYNERVHC